MQTHTEKGGDVCWLAANTSCLSNHDTHHVNLSPRMYSHLWLYGCDHILGFLEMSLYRLIFKDVWLDVWLDDS